MAKKLNSETETDEVEVTTTEKDSKSKPLTAALIGRLYDDARDETTTERLNYWLNRAFWLGDQWVWAPSYSSGTLIEPVTLDSRRRRDQATANKIQPAIHNNISRIMKVPLTLEVLAQAADDFAHQGAITGEGLLRQKGLDEDWEQHKEALATALLLGGTAGIITNWDTEAHRYSDDVTTGDACIDVLSIEDFVVEPGTLDAKRGRWWIRKQVLPPAAVQAQFKLPKEPKADASSGGPFNTKAAEFCSSVSKKEGTQVLTYFERPNFLRPEGAVAVAVGGKVVWGPEVWPFPFTDHLNLEVGVCIVDPERWTGETPVTQARSPQRQLNQLWTKIHETTHRTAGSKLLLDSRHAEMNNQLDDDPETPIVMAASTDAPVPKYLEPPKLAPHIIQELDLLENTIQDILGVHAISQGESPANIESGYGLSLLAEQDATPVGRLAKEIARMFAGAASNILKLYEDKVKDTRKTIVQDGRMAKPVKWSGKDLAGQTRAIVPPDSVLPRSHAGMQKMAMEMLQMKPDWFNSFSQWAAFASVPGVEDMTKIMDDDIARAQYENYRMGDGEVMEVFDFDDHAKHIQQHNHFRKSPAYLMLSKDARDIFDTHVAAHQSEAAHETGKKVAMQQMHPALGNTPMGGAGAPAPMPGMGMPPSGSEGLVPQIAEEEGLPNVP